MTETYTTKFTLCGKKMYVSWVFTRFVVQRNDSA